MTPVTLTLTEEITARELSAQHGVPIGIVRRDMLMMRDLPSWQLREIAGKPPTLFDRLRKFFRQ